MMGQASSARNKTAGSRRPARRSLGRQKWIVVGVTAFVMLLMCYSLVLLQRRFNLTGYFHRSRDAAVAAEVEGHQQDKELERDLQESRNTTLLSAETSKSRLKGKSRDRGTGAKKRRAKGTVKGGARNVVGDRPEEGTSRGAGATNPGFDADRELEALQNAFAARRRKADKKRRSTESSTAKVTTSTEMTSTGGTRSKLPGGVENQGTSRSTLESTSSTSASTVPTDTTMSGIASPSPSASLSSRGIRMVKKRRKLRLRIAVPSSTSHSTILSSAAGLRGVGGKLRQNVTKKPSAEKSINVSEQIAGHSSTTTFGHSHEANNKNSSTENRKTVGTAPTANNNGTGGRTGTKYAGNVAAAAVNETAERRRNSTLDEIKSPRINGTGNPKKPESSATTRSPSLHNISHATRGSRQTSQRKATVPVNNTSVLATHRSKSKGPQNSSTSSSPSPSPNNLTTNAQTSLSSATDVKLVNAKTGLHQATFSARGLSPSTYTKQMINVTFSSPPYLSMSNESGLVGNITTSFLFEPSETSTDSNRSIDAVLEGHIRTIDDIIRKILEKTGNNTGGFGFGNTTRGSEGSDTANSTPEGATKDAPSPNERNKGSGTTRLQPSVQTRGIFSSVKLPGTSGTMISENNADTRLTTVPGTNVTNDTGAPILTGKTSPVTHPSVNLLPKTKDTDMHASRKTNSTSKFARANETSVKEHSATRRPTKRVPRLASEAGQTISTPNITSRPQSTTEKLVTEAKLFLESTTGPPDEIVPEPEVTPTPLNTETTEPETSKTSTTFAYYTGKDEWIPEGGVRRLEGKGNHSGRKKKTLPKADAPHSKDLLDMDPAALLSDPERQVQHHEDVQAPQLRHGPERSASENRRYDVSPGEGPTALKADVNSELKILYSSLKDALEEEKKHRPNENSEEMQDDGNEHLSANYPSRSEEKFAAQSNANVPVESNLLVSKIPVHSSETSLQPDVGYPQGHNLGDDSNASKQVETRFLGIEQGSGAYTSPSGTFETGVPLRGREASIDKAGSSFVPDSEEHIRPPLAAAGTIGSEEDSSGSHHDYISRKPVEESSGHMNYGTGDGSQELASTQSTVKRPIVQIKDDVPTFFNGRTGGRESLSTTRSKSYDSIRWSAFEDKGSQYMSTEARPSTDMSIKAERASTLLDGGNDRSMGTTSWISSETSHQAEGSALPRQLEEFVTTRRESQLDGDHNESGRATDGELPILRRPGVVCVYNSSHSGWKSEGASYSIASIPYEYCSSVLYCCLTLDKELDFEGFGNHSDFRYLANMKRANPGMQTFVVIGGSGSPTSSFRHFVSNSIHQDVFIQLGVHWIRTREFDGAYMYWPQMEDQDGNDATNAYRYLANSFRKLNVKLGIILPSSSKYFAKETSLQALTDDLEGSFNAILLSPPEVDEVPHGTELAYHTKELTRAFDRYPTNLPGGSVPVCPMIPFWGRTFKMEVAIQDTGLALKPVGYGAPRAVSQELGKLAFFEYCRDLNSSASVFSAEEQVMIGNEYMALLTPASLEQHLTSMVQNKSWRCFGSWGPEWDDFAGHCGSARYPLLRTLYQFQVNHSIKRTVAIDARDAGAS